MGRINARRKYCDAMAISDNTQAKSGETNDAPKRNLHISIQDLISSSFKSIYQSRRFRPNGDTTYRRAVVLSTAINVLVSGLIDDQAL